MTDEAAKVSGRISFTIETTGQTYRFDTFKELLAWVDDQRQQWSAVSSSTVRNVFSNLSAQAVDITNTVFANLQNNLNSIVSNEPPPGTGATWPDEIINGHMNNLQQWLEPIVKGNIPTADSACGEEILILTPTDPRRAAAILILAIKHPNVNSQPVPNFETMRHILEEFRFPESRTRIGALENQLLKMRQRWDGKLTPLIRDLEKRRSKEDEALKKFRDDMGTGRKLIRQLFTTSNDERHNHAKEMKRIDETFHAHLALKAPATYWASKQTMHIIVAAISGIIFFALSGLAIWLVWQNGPTFVSAVTQDKAGFNMGAFAMITIPALFGAWSMRFVARIFVSNLHLGQDAGLRSTMITTYLALMKDPDSGVTREERALILNAMFRAADHHGEDDGPSPKLIELMRQMGGR